MMTIKFKIDQKAIKDNAKYKRVHEVSLQFWETEGSINVKSGVHYDSIDF